MASTFRFSAIERLVFGPGCVDAKLISVCRQLQLARVFVLSTPSLERNGQVQQVCDRLGELCCGRFTGSVAHTPRSVVLAAAQQAKDANADAILTLGGSSVVDLAKGVTLVLGEGAEFDALKVNYDPQAGLRMPTLVQPKLPIIAVPTTLSGSEFTAGAGLTDEQRGEKDLYVDAKITPRVVFHDGALAAATPVDLWLQTGMKIVGDCIEFLSSPKSNPIVHSLSLGALRLLADNLPSTRNPANTQARQNCLHAVFLVMSSSTSAGAGLVAGLRHQLGAHLGIAHGVASTIVLPHVMRWNLEHVENKYANAAQQLGLSDGSEPVDNNTLIQFVEQLIDQLAIPAHLSEVGVSTTQLPAIAEQTLHDFVIINNPRPVKTAEQVQSILEHAF